MLHHVLTARQVLLVHQLTLFLFLVSMERIQLDYKLPVLFALQAWPAHQPQQPQHLPIIVYLVPTVLEDKTSVLYALRDMPVHRDILTISSYVEKGHMHLVVLIIVLHALLASIVLILQLLLFHVPMAITVQHVLCHVHHALRGTVVLLLVCHQSSAKLVTIVTDMLQSAHLVNQVSSPESLFVFT